MPYELRFSSIAEETLRKLETGGKATAVKLKKVRRALGRLQSNPLYPGLNSHPYQRFPGLEKTKVWDSYVENHTPGAWRIYWRYGPDERRGNHEKAVITILLIGPRL